MCIIAVNEKEQKSVSMENPIEGNAVFEVHVINSPAYGHDHYYLSYSHTISAKGPCMRVCSKSESFRTLLSLEPS